MNPIRKLVQHLSRLARAKRAEIFRSTFYLDENTKILDLGSEDGSNIKAVIEGTRVQHENVYIADINPEAVAKGNNKYGFIPVVIDESEKLPFEANFFDIVYCSSVIEHVTIPKNEVWTLYSDRRFKAESLKRQKEFASEIERLGKQFFVQTPYRHFPIESHSWLPFAAWLPRRILIPVLKISNRFWVKKTSPDWYLLNKTEMRDLFNDADIQVEKKFRLIKSIIATKSDNSCPDS